MERLEFFGLSFFTGCYAAIVCKSTQALDLEKILQTDGEEGFNLDIMREEGIEEKMGPDLIHFIQKFF